MGLIIDTCILIQAERNKKAFDFNRWEKYESVFLSAITVSELLIGVHRASSEDRKIHRSAFVETVISEIPILDFTAETARIHAEICAYLLEKGQIIGSHDLLIAATALTHGCALLTSNKGEFERVPGLTVVSPDS